MSTTARSPDTMNVEDLLAHIAECQQSCRRDLPELIELARKVERVHHDVADAPLGLGEALVRMADDLDRHANVEEQVLFPALRHKLDGAVPQPISLMRSEHQAHAVQLEGIESLAHHFVPPEGACGSWQRLYRGLARFSADLREQIRLENEVLFPRFEVLASTRCTCAHA